VFCYHAYIRRDPPRLPAFSLRLPHCRGHLRCALPLGSGARPVRGSAQRSNRWGAELDSFVGTRAPCVFIAAVVPLAFLAPRAFAAPPHRILSHGKDVRSLVQVVISASALPLSARRGGTARAPRSTIPLFMPYGRLPHTVLHSRLFLTPRRGRGPLSGTAALRAGLPPQCQRTQLVAVAPAEVAPWRRASTAIPPAGGTFGNVVSAAPPGNVQPGGR
jgi:hypothetical protein